MLESLRKFRQTLVETQVVMAGIPRWRDREVTAEEYLKNGVVRIELVALSGSFSTRPDTRTSLVLRRIDRLRNSFKIEEEVLTRGRIDSEAGEGLVVVGGSNWKQCVWQRGLWLHQNGYQVILDEALSTYKHSV